MANITFIPNVGSKATSNILTLEDVPEEVKQDVEQVYEALKNQNGRMHVSFPTVADLNTYISQVVTYCKLRPAGEISYRKSPSRGLKPNEMHFRITDLQTPNEKTTEEIRENVEEVKTAAKRNSAK